VRPSTQELERLLRSARAQPRADFVRELEASLPAPRASARPPRWRVAFAACAAAAALVAVTIVLGATGVLPFSVGAGKDAQAGQDCRIVWVERFERQAYIVHGHNGRLRVAYRLRPVQRPVKRCR
jgi:hypothetical protein